MNCLGLNHQPLHDDSALFRYAQREHRPKPDLETRGPIFMPGRGGSAINTFQFIFQRSLLMKNVLCAIPFALPRLLGASLLGLVFCKASAYTVGERHLVAHEDSAKLRDSHICDWKESS